MDHLIDKVLGLFHQNWIVLPAEPICTYETSNVTNSGFEQTALNQLQLKGEKM